MSMCITSNRSCLQKKHEAGPNVMLLSPTVLDLFPERLVHTEAMKVSKQAQYVYQKVHHSLVADTLKLYMLAG